MNSLIKSFIAGGIAGCMVDLLLFPIDSIKTRIQMKQSISLPISELYKGIKWSLFSSFPCAATFWTFFTMSKLLLASFYSDSYLVDFFSACVGSFACCLVRCPFELLKTMTINGKIANIREDILQKEGIFGLYTGLSALMYRELPFDSIQMLLYSIFSSFWVLNFNIGPFSLSGALAGAFTGFLTTPIDVIKTRMMSDRKKFQSFSKCAAIIYRAEGVSGLWRGWKPRVLFITLGGWVFFGSFNFILEMLG